MTTKLNRGQAKRAELAGRRACLERRAPDQRAAQGHQSKSNNIARANAQDHREPHTHFGRKRHHRLPIGPGGGTPLKLTTRVITQHAAM